MFCKECGKEFTPTKRGMGDKTKGGRIFCNRNCSNLFHQKKYRAEHRSEYLAQQDKYKSTHREVGLAWQKKYRKTHDLSAQFKAMSIVRNAVKKGILLKPASCSQCGKIPKRIEAHHYNGYENPLDIIWVCTSCHRKLHFPVPYNQ